MSRRESDIQKEIIQILRLKHRIIAHPVKGREMPDGRTCHRWDKGGTTGVSDLAATLPGGRALWIEVKAPGGVIRPAQSDFILHQQAMGALAFVAYSVADVEAKLQEEGL